MCIYIYICTVCTYQFSVILPRDIWAYNKGAPNSAGSPGGSKVGFQIRTSEELPRDGEGSEEEEEKAGFVKTTWLE